MQGVSTQQNLNFDEVNAVYKSPMQNIPPLKLNKQINT